MKIIDSHNHFWNYNGDEYPWITCAMDSLKKDYVPKEFSRILEIHNIKGAVSVQARHSERETQMLLNYSAKYDKVLGVVGWLDFFGVEFQEKLEFYSQNGYLKGLRHIVQNEPKGFMAQTAFIKGIGLLGRYKFTYDILIFDNQLPEAIHLVRQFPDQIFVLDHMAKPKVKG